MSRTETIVPANPGFNLLYVCVVPEKTEDEVRHSLAVQPIVSWLHVLDGEGDVDVVPIVIEPVALWDDPRYVIGIEYPDGQVLVPEKEQLRNHAEFVEYAVLSRIPGEKSERVSDDVYAGAQISNLLNTGAV